MTSCLCVGSLPAGTTVAKGADGVLRVGGKELPPGAKVITNPDGTQSISGIVPVHMFQLFTFKVMIAWVSLRGSN